MAMGGIDFTESWKLVAIGCDGDVTNTGKSGGVIWLLEEKETFAVAYLPASCK